MKKKPDVDVTPYRKTVRFPLWKFVLRNLSSITIFQLMPSMYEDEQVILQPAGCREYLCVYNLRQPQIKISSSKAGVLDPYCLDLAAETKQ